MDIVTLALAKKYADMHGASALKFKGSCNFEDLPTSDLEVGDMWDILDDFIIDGKKYPAGTNIAWTGENWDALSGNIDLSGKEDIFRYSTMPIANEDFENKIIQFIGTTTANYINGHFYKCVSDGLTPVTYSWEEIAFGGNEKIAYTYAYIEDFPKDSQNYYLITNDLKPYTIIRSKVRGTPSMRIKGTTSRSFSFTSNGDYLMWYDSDYTTPETATSSNPIHFKRFCNPQANNFSLDIGGTIVYTFNNATYADRCDFGDNYLYFNRQQTITGTYTFNTLPESSVVPTTNNQLANKKYVDDSIAASITNAIEGEY